MLKVYFHDKCIRNFRTNARYTIEELSSFAQYWKRVVELFSELHHVFEVVF